MLQRTMMFRRLMPVSLRVRCSAWFAAALWCMAAACGPERIELSILPEDGCEGVCAEMDLSCVSQLSVAIVAAGSEERACIELAPDRQVRTLCDHDLAGAISLDVQGDISSIQVIGHGASEGEPCEGPTHFVAEGSYEPGARTIALTGWCEASCEGEGGGGGEGEPLEP